MIEYSGNVVLSMFLRYRDMIMAMIINLVVSVVLFLKLMGVRSRKESLRDNILLAFRPVQILQFIRYLNLPALLIIFNEILYDIVMW